MSAPATIRELERRLAATPSSPLFARLAHALLTHGEVARAESLCERGLELYPHYATGRLVYARCLAARGRWAGALGELSAVASSYPGNIVLADIEEAWRARAAEEGPVVADDGAVFTEVVPPAADMPDEAPLVEPPLIEAEVIEQGVVEDAAAGSETFDPGSGAPPVPVPGTSVPDHEEVMYGEGAVPPAPVPTSRPGTVPILQPIPPSLHRTSFIEPDRIVSRTLAEIYASQGAIHEAVETYRILLDRMPGRNASMEERLRELEERMGHDAGPAPRGEE